MPRRSSPRATPPLLSAPLAPGGALAEPAPSLGVIGRRRSSATRTPGRRAWATLAAVIAAGMAFVVPVLAPPPADPEGVCGWFHPVIGDHGFVENCDAPVFVAEARDPSLLFRENDLRQSRPGFVVAGSAVGYALRPIAAIGGLDAEQTYEAGYLLINLATLAAGVVLGWTLLTRAGVRVELRVALVVVLVVNDVTKAFMWSAHTQIFTVLVPLLLTALVDAVLRRPDLRRIDLAAIGLGLGLGFLTSGLLLLGPPAVLAARLLGRWRAGSVSPTRSLGDALAIAMPFALPMLTWMAIVRSVVGSFYSHETAQYRQFVWVADALEVGPGQLRSQALAFTEAFAGTWESMQIAPFVALVMVVVGRRLATGHGLGLGSERLGRADPRRDIQLSALVVVALLGAFTWALGYYQTRLTFAVVPPIGVLLAVELDRLRRRPDLLMAILVTGGAMWWIAQHVIRAGPYQ